MVPLQLCIPIYSWRTEAGERGRWGGQGNYFMLFQTTSISEIVSHHSASAPIQTGTEETRSILLPNWSFPGEALVCKTYWQGRFFFFFLNKQGIKTGAPSELRGRQGHWQEGIDCVHSSSKWADWGESRKWPLRMLRRKEDSREVKANTRQLKCPWLWIYTIRWCHWLYV